MKTSNKMLLVLIAIMLAIPPLLLLAFRTQINTNQYTTHYSNGTRIVHQPVAAPKYLVVEGKGLECNILHADSSYVDYYQPEDEPDSIINVITRGDTLFVTIDTTHSTEQAGYADAYYLRSAKVYLPNLENLITRYAVVNLDTVSNDLHITARGGSCNVARYNLISGGYTRYGREPDELYTYSITNAKGETTPWYSHITRLSVDAEESAVCIGSIAMIDTLSITAQKESSLNIKKEAIIKQLKTQLDSSTQVNVNKHYIKRIATDL